MAQAQFTISDDGKIATVILPLHDYPKRSGQPGGQAGKNMVLGSARPQVVVGDQVIAAQVTIMRPPTPAEDAVPAGTFATPEILARLAETAT